MSKSMTCLNAHIELVQHATTELVRVHSCVGSMLAACAVSLLTQTLVSDHAVLAGNRV